MMGVIVDSAWDDRMKCIILRERFFLTCVQSPWDMMVTKPGSSARQKSCETTLTMAPSLLSTQACTGCPLHPSHPESLLWRGLWAGLQWIFSCVLLLTIVFLGSTHKAEHSQRVFCPLAAVSRTDSLEQEKWTLLSRGQMWPGSSVLSLVLFQVLFPSPA